MIQNFNNKLKYSYLVNLLCILVTYIWFLQRNVYNVPFWDDFNICLDFINHYVQSSSFKEHLKLLFEQNNEHVIAYTKLIELVQFSLMGKINFIWLVVILNLSLFVIIAFMTQYGGFPISRLEAYMIYFPLLLNPLQFENQIWTGAGIQQFGQILCSLIILKLLSNYLKTTKKTIFLCSLLLLFINSIIGGGFLALYLSIITFLMYQKKWSEGIIIGVLFLFNLWFIFRFLPYVFYSHEYSAPLINYVYSFITFMGAYFPQHGVLAGGIILLILIFFHKDLFKNNFYCGFIFFFIITAVLVAISRAHIDKNQAWSRYSIYAIIFLGMFLSFLHAKIKSSAIRNLLLLLPSAFFFYKFMHVAILDPKNTQHYQDNYLTWRKHNVVTGEISYSKENIKQAVNIYLESKRLGIYSNADMDKWIGQQHYLSDTK